MGDMADYLTEQGEDAYFLHLADNCLSECQYCEEEYQKQRREAKQLLKKEKENELNSK